MTKPGKIYNNWVIKQTLSNIRERLKRGWSIDQALKTPTTNLKGERV